MNVDDFVVDKMSISLTLLNMYSRKRTWQNEFAKLICHIYHILTRIIKTSVTNDDSFGYNIVVDLKLHTSSIVGKNIKLNIRLLYS